MERESTHFGRRERGNDRTRERTRASTSPRKVSEADLREAHIDAGQAASAHDPRMQQHTSIAAHHQHVAHTLPYHLLLNHSN